MEMRGQQRKKGGEMREKDNKRSPGDEDAEELRKRAVLPVYRKNFFKILIGVAILWVLLMVAMFMGTHPYPELIDHIAPQTREILRDHGLPAYEKKEQPWFRWTGRPGYYTLYFYRADEIPQAAKLEIIKLCMTLYEERGRKEQFRIFMYQEKEDEKRKWFSGVKPFFELTVGGSN